MSPTRSIALSFMLGPLMLSLGGCAQPTPTPPAKEAAAPAHDAAMDMHHLHGLMAHGFEMALEGATLKMLGQMSMAAGVDASAVAHGGAMLTEGKALIDKALTGPAMTAVHAANATDPVMTYTHELGKTMSEVLDHLQQMPAANAKNPKEMAMHHQHIALVHAALMASQGASLKMTASMKMADAVDQEAVTHSTAMFGHARSLYDDTMNGDAMKAAHAGAGGGSSMTSTHELGDSINRVIDQLSKMP
ncbi:MAG: hypothetical protein ABMA15_18280 [Vicinamibacterales bacterium]